MNVIVDIERIQNFGVKSLGKAKGRDLLLISGGCVISG